jgi:hypothetical protein
VAACGNCGRAMAPDKMLCRHCGCYTTTGAAGGIVSEAGIVDAFDVKAESTSKIITGEWWDEAWGGNNPGFMPTECVLVAGAPGMGKSTLLILIGFAFWKITGKSTYYISTEQTKEEWKTYLDRMNLPIERGTFKVLNTMGAGCQIDEEVFKKDPPGLLILDSVTAACGKDRAAQVVVCDNYKKNYSAKYKCPSLIISHINKEGDLAGEMTMQHNVDGICSLFPNDKERSKFAGQPVFEFHKHRFGPCHKEYQLIMAENGLHYVPPKKAGPMKSGGDVLLAEIRGDDPEKKDKDPSDSSDRKSSERVVEENDLEENDLEEEEDLDDLDDDEEDDDGDLDDENLTPAMKQELAKKVAEREEEEREEEHKRAAKKVAKKKPDAVKKDSIARDIRAVVPKKVPLPETKEPHKPTAAERAAETYRKKFQASEARIAELEAKLAGHDARNRDDALRLGSVAEEETLEVGSKTRHAGAVKSAKKTSRKKKSRRKDGTARSTKASARTAPKDRRLVQR